MKAIDPALLKKLGFIASDEHVTELDYRILDSIKYRNLTIFINFMSKFIDTEGGFNSIEDFYLNLKSRGCTDLLKLQIYLNIFSILKAFVHYSVYDRLENSYTSVPHIVIPFKTLQTAGPYIRNEVSRYREELWSVFGGSKTTKDVLQYKAEMNIIMASLCRCSNIRVVNNAKKKEYINQFRELRFTDGTTVVIDNKVVVGLKDLIPLRAKYPTSIPKAYRYKKEDSLKDLYAKELDGITL